MRLEKDLKIACLAVPPDCIVFFVTVFHCSDVTSPRLTRGFIFMLAATLFLELWKSYSAEITHRWDLTGLDIQEEHPRPEYLARLAHVKKKSVNVVTNTVEPRVPFWKVRLPATIISFSVVLLLVGFELSSTHSIVVNL